MPKLLSFTEKEISVQLQAQLGEDLLKTPMGMDILKQALEQVNGAIAEKVQAQLEAQLGEEFFKMEEGQEILKQLSLLM